MSLPNTERLAIALECHDPAGDQVRVTETELLSHILVIGATGSGKTTRAILPAFDDLCRGFNGLLLVDGKGDEDFREGVLESARRHGRSVVEIDGTGFDGIDLFGPMRKRGMDGIQAVVERICAGLPVDQRNRYWDVTFGKLASAALAMLQIASPGFGYAEAVDWLERYLLSFSANSPEILEREGRLRDMLDDSGDEELQGHLKGVLRSHEMWAMLDIRTRSNLQSMALSVVEPLRSQRSRFFFAAARSHDLTELMQEEKIVLLRVDGFGDRSLARLVTTVAKAAFYRGLFERKEIRSPWGLLLDDWSLVLTGGLESDCSESAALPFIRSKKGFVIAACQSLSEIDARIGRMERESAVANFGTLLFMRSRDLETDLLAHRSFVVPDREVAESWKMGSVQSQTWNTVRRFEGSLLPPGKLSRLETGEAWVSVCGTIKEQSVMLAPYWEIKGKWEGGDHAAK